MPLPLAGLALAGLSGLAGGLGNRGDSLTPDEKKLREALIQQQMSLFEGTDLSGFEASQADTINTNADIERKKLLETLAARGIGGPAVGFAESNLDRNRVSDITKLHQMIPMMAQSLKTEAIGSGSNLFANLRAGRAQQGNVGAGIFGNLGTSLAYLYGQGAFTKPQGQNTGLNTLHL